MRRPQKPRVLFLPSEEAKDTAYYIRAGELKNEAFRNTCFFISGKAEEGAKHE